jgi:2-amino-4-hydroxy-6-hydroxymethyldihydropteridine diphosphokinase
MIHLNIGSNLSSKHGSRFDNISLAVNFLLNSKITIKKISNFYETPSYPNKNFPKFLNVGLIVDYQDNYFSLLREIKFIEKKLGRIRTQRNNPRIIDIDIIDFNNEIKKTDKLILPHPKCHLRNFVLYPISQISPKWSHPIIKKNVQFLIDNLSQRSRIEITRLHKNVNILI